MPIYTYKCSNPDCENEEDVIRAYEDNSPCPCEKCGCEMRRELSVYGCYSMKGATSTQYTHSPKRRN